MTVVVHLPFSALWQRDENVLHSILVTTTRLCQKQINKLCT